MKKILQKYFPIYPINVLTVLFLILNRNIDVSLEIVSYIYEEIN